MNISGFLILNKPKNVTSFFCVKTIRKILKAPVKKLRIGHGGTLDDFAIGVLIIGIGRQATRHLSQLLNCDKTYTVTAKLGQLTNTLDYTGTTIKEHDASHISESDVRKALKDLGASYEQTPPLFSALKHEGAPLYKLARNQQADLEKLNEIAEKKRRTVKLLHLELTDFLITHQLSQYLYALATDHIRHILVYEDYIILFPF